MSATCARHDLVRAASSADRIDHGPPGQTRFGSPGIPRVTLRGGLDRRGAHHIATRSARPTTGTAHDASRTARRDHGQSGHQTLHVSSRTACSCRWPRAARVRGSVRPSEPLGATSHALAPSSTQRRSTGPAPLDQHRPRSPSATSRRASRGRNRWGPTRRRAQRRRQAATPSPTFGARTGRCRTVPIQTAAAAARGRGSVGVDDRDPLAAECGRGEGEGTVATPRGGPATVTVVPRGVRRPKEPAEGGQPAPARAAADSDTLGSMAAPYRTVPTTCSSPQADLYASRPKDFSPVTGTWRHGSMPRA